MLARCNSCGTDDWVCSQRALTHAVTVWGLHNKQKAEPDTPFLPRIIVNPLNPKLNKAKTALRKEVCNKTGLACFNRDAR